MNSSFWKQQTIPKLRYARIQLEKNQCTGKPKDTNIYKCIIVHVQLCTSQEHNEVPAAKLIIQFFSILQPDTDKDIGQIRLQ
uniref:Uncharacterized protein n=1 Tax=Arundo donax TaxID=35708 RepID=A0A0A9A5Z6_ARUDO